VICRTRLSAIVIAFVASGAIAAPLSIDLPGTSIPVDTAGPYARATLTLSGPDGKLTQQSVAGSDRIKLGNALPDGQYRYRIDFAPASTVTRRDGISATPTAASGPAEGSFRVEGGHVYVAAAAANRRDASGGAAPSDVVTADNAIIQGSACIGFNCVNGESFGFDTLRLKEDNTRIAFVDTSTGAGYANTHWQLTANDNAIGGLNKFSIEDITASTVPFTVLGAAPNDSLYIASTGRIGLHTNTPGLDVHIYTRDTPAIRLDQNNSGGFTAQTWDIGGNEANFFVRDLTGGSLLPLRIRPRAPTSSVDISASGAVGFGTASPSARVDVEYDTVLGSPVPVLRVTNKDGSVDPAQQDRFVVDSSGDVLARGTISQLSSRSAKENFVATDGQVLLAKLERMPVSSWNYRGAPAQERHLGPVAEDFHAAFGLGASNRYIAPADMAGVALASVKALQDEIKQRDEHIEQLEQRLRALEARLDAPER
jgi:hypothetical protein